LSWSSLGVCVSLGGWRGSGAESASDFCGFCSVGEAYRRRERWSLKGGFKHP